MTVRSLALSNADKEKRLGDGRTLTVMSGGLLFLAGGSAIGVADGGAENGTLVLGDATHPAYVWARGSATNPNAIWAPVEARGGFVAAYTGQLVLGGTQTNILTEIAVNAGTLQLGTDDSACRLVKNLPIRVFANAALRIPNAGSATKNILLHDGAAGWFGKVEIPAGVEAQAKKAYWRDYPETPDWQSIPRGTYTGDENTAAILGCTYDPERFAGAGTIRIVQDDRILPAMLILR